MTTSNYIITFKKDTPDDVLEAKAKEIEASGAKIKHRYNAALKGFSVEVPDASIQAVSTMTNSEHVDGVEADGEVTTQGAALLKA
ncbi:hypothetical protein LRAMOSA00190 [Lichtheimia ramosa]|uniref:Inhibitor I9 domain-containing protein n=1 Tax=Lichtheimia ramosa TaxID=688394 RepID=A0A077W6Q0_9FUNG|nr:hypothetical protein LRAMOSA00190 [Lichtheimia ramosa]